MKIALQNRRDGLTRTDVIVVIAAVILLAAFFLFIFPLARVSAKAPRITCVNNLKQIALSFRIYAGDNRDKYPMDISTNTEPLVLEGTPVFRYFQSISNELGVTKILLCPAEIERKWAQDFQTLGDTNISYFVGLDAKEDTTRILSGDRNIENGIAPVDGVLRLTKNQELRFTKGIHKNQGNIALADGSVLMISSAGLESEIIPNTGLATNRIKLP